MRSVTLSKGISDLRYFLVNCGPLDGPEPGDVRFDVSVEFPADLRVYDVEIEGESRNLFVESGTEGSGDVISGLKAGLV